MLVIKRDSGAVWTVADSGVCYQEDDNMTGAIPPPCERQRIEYHAAMNAANRADIRAHAANCPTVADEPWADVGVWPCGYPTTHHDAEHKRWGRVGQWLDAEAHIILCNAES